MISRSIIKSAQKAASYYSDVQRAAEYYGGEQVPSEWLGAGAAIQGLRGTVREDALVAQLEGRVNDSTGNNRQLGVTRNGELQHRAGYDFTVSAPKSVSIEALVHGRDDVVKAHDRAVREAFDYLQEMAAQSRINGEMVRTGNLTAAAYQHVSSRSGDPQLHTHLLISNVTFDKTGKAYSLSSERLFEYRRAADAVYQNRLSLELQKIGYSVRADREGRVEIAGYEPGQLRDWSTRRAEIRAAIEARGGNLDTAGFEARQVAALATRLAKDLPEARQAHQDRWCAQAEALGIQAAARDAVPARARHQAEAAREALAAAGEHLSERESVWSERTLHQEAARFAAGTVSWDAIKSAIEEAQRRGELIREAERGDRFTTRAALASEQVMAARLDAGRGEHESILSGDQFDRALASFEQDKGFKLSDEQRAAAHLILTGRDRYQGIQGLAGTGKTTLLSFVREAAESAGWRVSGHSNGSEQAAVMERESGIETTTTAAWLLASERSAPATRDERVLYVMDEASQAGQRQFGQVIETTERSGARTVFLGDVRQHQSVEAGRAFERAQAHMPTARLGADSIRRQRTAELKQRVSEILAGRHGEAVRQLPAVEIRAGQDSLPADADRETRRAAARLDNAAVIQKLASDYSSMSPEDRRRTLVLTSTNADRQAINSAIRDGLKQRGELGAGVNVKTLRKVDLTAEEAKRAESYSAGQVVEVQSNSRRQQLARGSQWEVIDARAGHLHVRDAEGRERLIDPRSARLQAYDVESREFSVGDRLRWTEGHRAQRADHPLEDGLRVRNGQTAIVERVSADRITLRCADGEQIQIDARAGAKLDHSYAVTSHSAQGLTVDRALIHHNTEQGAHSQRETYVDVTRSRDGVTFYTQDLDKASRQAGLDLSKTAAHDIVPVAAPPDPLRDPDRAPTHDDGPQFG